MTSPNSTPAAPHHHHQQPTSTKSSANIPDNNTSNSRSSFPFSFRLPFQSNPSPTSLVQSTAEGRAIPVDNSTAEHRTSALRELNHNYPSRHRYAKSTGAQSSTYSEPVIVRSYYPPLASSRPHSVRRGGVVVHALPTMRSSTNTATTASKRIPPVEKASTTTGANGGVLSFMARVRGRTDAGSAGNAGNGGGHHQDAKLPPVEAFTFKSFLDKMEEDGQSNDIHADLDRIAEICARSKYSLSNQYEVHHAPHGSGAEFLATAQKREHQGPTLQAVSSEDERVPKRSRRPNVSGKRNSRAMGTLETIMSTSRSSDEDKTKKKSAAELAEEVRGRAARKPSDAAVSSPPSVSSHSDESQSQHEDDGTQSRLPAKRTSSSLALMDGAKQSTSSVDASATRISTVPVGEPALPQPSTSQLEIRTSPSKPQTAKSNIAPRPKSDSFTPDKLTSQSTPNGATPSVDSTMATGFLSTLVGWMPWTVSEEGGKAEGSLRELLKTTDVKVKSTRTEQNM